MTTLEIDSQDSLVQAKVSQVSQANARRNMAFPFTIGDSVMFSTLYRHQEYKSNDARRVAKFMPHFDGPYQVIATDKPHSTVTLDLPDNLNIFPVFHTSEL